MFTHANFQLKVWEFACSNPRIVGVDFIRKEKDDSVFEGHGPLPESQTCTRLMLVTPKATMLEVSIEARVVFMKETISLVSSGLADDRQRLPNIRFNLKHDILWLLDIPGFSSVCNAHKVEVKVRSARLLGPGISEITRDFKRSTRAPCATLLKKYQSMRYISVNIHSEVRHKLPTPGG